MSYDLKIAGLANKDELVKQGPADHRLFKFLLSKEPDGFWVLLLQHASERTPDVTLSASEKSKELWVSAPGSLSAKVVLERAQGAVQAANADANEAAKRYEKKEEPAAAMAHQAFVSELDELSFDEGEAAEDGEAAGEGGAGAGAPSALEAFGTLPPGVRIGPPPTGSGEPGAS